MELYGDQVQVDWGQETGLEESVRNVNLWDGEVYPERPGLTDCAYYMRTGSCGYGSKCRYNHPPDRISSLAAGDYPERAGEPPCQFYLRTGTCKFGASCKFDHPKHAGGALMSAPLNIYGHPLRPGEKECSYYLKTGQCKFGRTCKFDHPQPADASVPAPARPFYPTVQSLSSSSEHYDSTKTGYRVTRPLLPGSYMTGAYGPMMLPGVVSMPNWSPYSGSVNPSPSSGAQPSVGATSVYGLPQSGSSAPTLIGQSGGVKREQQFPERPGQPDCKYYMKTGDCKYGASCRYNHPPDLVVSKSNCTLSSLGLPLRPGVQACAFYLQNGHCKFGQTCIFDHPMATVDFSRGAPYTEMPGSKLDLGTTRVQQYGSTFNGFCGPNEIRILSCPALLNYVQLKCKKLQTTAQMHHL